MTEYNLLNGNECSKTLLNKLKQQITDNITLAVIQIGNISASSLYINKKVAACKAVGITPLTFKFDNTIDEASLLNKINMLNQDKSVNGILVQLPLPQHINTTNIVKAINPDKDVDGFHPYNLGLLAQRTPKLQPCTPYGIKLLLDYYQIDIKGLNTVIVGASNIVGLPTALSCLLAQATVTICHSNTKNLNYHINNAECLISAIGNPNVIDAKMIKPGAIVIDVGINHVNNKLTGDIDFSIACNRAAFITPVPGGVGPMTVAALLLNTFQAYQIQKKL